MPQDQESRTGARFNLPSELVARLQTEAHRRRSVRRRGKPLPALAPNPQPAPVEALSTDMPDRKFLDKVSAAIADAYEEHDVSPEDVVMCARSFGLADEDLVTALAGRDFKDEKFEDGK